MLSIDKIPDAQDPHEYCADIMIDSTRNTMKNDDDEKSRKNKIVY